MKKATIVIPTYKRADRIARAVESALAQTYKNLEVIVVDDNGKDSQCAHDTKGILQSCIDDGRIIYIQNDFNRGGSFSRNQGLSISTGDYITFLDDDDEIDKEKVKKQIEKIESLDNSYSCVYCGYKKILGKDKVYFSSEKASGDVYKYALSRSLYVGSGSNLLVKTSIAREIGGYDVEFKRNQDLEFLTRLLKNYKLAYIDEILLTVHYEIREVKRNYDDLVKIDNFYLSKFKSDIDSLDTKTQNNIHFIFALERFRYSIGNNIIDGIRNMLKNRVSLYKFIKYIIYLIDRIINKKSYGFKG